MQAITNPKRLAFLVLCGSLLLIVPLAGARPLRIPVVHEAIGVALFAVVATAARLLSRFQPAHAADDRRRLQLAGFLLVSPFALIGLLWVGLGTPWDATPAENEMRYAVLLAAAIAVTGGLALLRDALGEAGERLFAPVGATAALLSGAAFVVWSSFQLGYHAMVAAQAALPPALAAANDVFDATLFAAGALAYAATAAFAHALGRAGWLGRRASSVYVALNLVALVLLLLRGVSFPAPDAAPEPWFTRPGFVVGIPAMPWVMPFLLGAVLLRRAGEPAR